MGYNPRPLRSTWKSLFSFALSFSRLREKVDQGKRAWRISSSGVATHHAGQFAIPQQIKKTPLDERRFGLERFAWL